MTLPRVYQFVMAQAHGDLRPEFAPPFDTLKLDIHLSEPDYSLDLDTSASRRWKRCRKTRSTPPNIFISMMGDLRNRPPHHLYRPHHPHRACVGGWQGWPRAHRILRKARGESAGAPELDRCAGQASRSSERNLPALTGDMQPRLIQARVKAGEDGRGEPDLAAARRFSPRTNTTIGSMLEGQDQVDRSIFSVEQARGQLHWLEQMHAAGLYRDDLAYPHLKQMAMEFELPPAADRKSRQPAPREQFATCAGHRAPMTPRPMIAGITRPQTRERRRSCNGTSRSAPQKTPPSWRASPRIPA